MGILGNLEDSAWEWAWLRRLWKPLFKRIVAGQWGPLIMRPCVPSPMSAVAHLGLYLHVPFCHRTCPFCPYHRVTHEAEAYARYEAAVHREIDSVSAAVGDAYRAQGRALPAVGSLYIGGGTPTVDPAGVVRMVDHLRAAFGPIRDTCVEMHPACMDDACLDALRGAGVTMLSVGVESLHDGILQTIGRSHDAPTAVMAVRRAVRHGFDAVNADLMFALPGQALDDLDADVRQLLELGIDQLSTYPMFGFPYTDLGRQLNIRRVKRPPSQLIRAMLAHIHHRAEEAGMKRCAIWSFVRPGRKKFSSITRHHTLGFGPSAASMTGRQFRVNTFSLEAYDRITGDPGPGRAIGIPFPERLEMAYWLYWRVYEMWIPRQDFRVLFGRDLEDVWGMLLRACCLLGYLERSREGYRVAEKASYAIHRLQNEYALNAINRLWGRCREEEWPLEISL